MENDFLFTEHPTGLVEYRDKPHDKGYRIVETGYFVINSAREIIQWRHFSKNLRAKCEQAGYVFTHVDLDKIRLRLEYLREELREERISMGELAELQSLAKHIGPSDVELLEAAGIPENSN